jgi:UDP-glucose 4-epimerase
MILIVGGAGYIGSHVVKELVKTHQIVVLDNLSTGHSWAINNEAIFIEGDLGDEALLYNIFSTYPIKGVMHFAANSLVGESVQNPLKYYENNVQSTLILLKSMLHHCVNHFIFSSTAATYGIPDVDVITEESVANPINPYGRSKWMIEQILSDFALAYGMSYVILRYFNAAGADPLGEIGEAHNPETHLIPITLQHLLGQRESVTIFGNDYNTLDGTCLRDYIHVADLARAHIMSLQGLQNGKIQNSTYNLGNGKGYSVKEIIETCEKITGKQATVIFGERREGDPAKLVASSVKIERELGWKANLDLEKMITDAWNWHKNYLNLDSNPTTKKFALR